MKKHLSASILLTTAALIALVLLVGAGILGTSRWACASCHGGFAKAQAHGQHGTVVCVACHGSGAAARTTLAGNVLLRMVPAKLVGRHVSGPSREIPRTACLTCHRAVESPGVAESNGLRIDHSTCAQDASCDICHSTTAHGEMTRWKRASRMEDCTACHAQKKASLECDACHRGKSTTDRLAVGPWQVTHGSNWQQTHGMGQLDSCATCHPRDYCARCHKTTVPHDARFGSTHGADAVSDRAACLQCHKTQAFCDSCHGMPMPHPVDFIKSHASVAGSVDAPLCQRCHSRANCEACHVAHVHPGFTAVNLDAAAKAGGR